MNRRNVLKLSTGFSAALLLARFTDHPAWGQDTKQSLQKEGGMVFSESNLLEEAKALSQKPYNPIAKSVQPPYDTINYDQYRAIRFKKSAAIWGNENLDCSLELFSAGYIYNSPIQIFLIEGEHYRELEYTSDLFDYGPNVPKPSADTKIGFSGFRIHKPVNRADILDEFVVFQGASYFRAKATGQDYGLSARGLALNTAQPGGDEFPIFRRFWILKPAPKAKTVTVYALLDSESVSGLYKFVIWNAHNTIMDVDCTLFPRKDLRYPGLAPLTSMFFFAPSNKKRADEVRFRVHDSDGLAIWNGKDEHIWRPLINANTNQFSVFVDDSLKGFGLLQRERRADRYQDLSVPYELRPSLWVEPRNNWGQGSVDLVELTTVNEYVDNIVAYWRPKDPIVPGRSYSYSYRLHWCYEPPIRQNYAVVSQTLVGASTQNPGMRLFYIDFGGTDGMGFCDTHSSSCDFIRRNLELNASAGTIHNVAFEKNRISGGHRVGFEYEPAKGSIEADLRCALLIDGKPVSEVWIYRWTS